MPSVEWIKLTQQPTSVSGDLAKLQALICEILLPVRSNKLTASMMQPDNLPMRIEYR